MQTTPQERIDDYTRRGWWGSRTLLTLFDDAVADSADHLALVDQFNRSTFTDGAPLRLTFAEVADAVDQVCAQFHAAGLRQDDKVVIQLPNIAELAIVYLALSRLGVVSSPVPVQYGQFELAKASEQLDPVCYISLSNLKGKNLISEHGAAFNADCRMLYFGEAQVDGATGLSLSGTDESALEAARAYTESLNHDANDVFTICWTSGTTGQPKGVPRSHNLWISSAIGANDVAELRKHEALLNPFPMVNMAGISGFMYPWLMRHATLVLHQPFDLPIYLKQLEDEKIGYTIAPPAVLTMLLKKRELLDAADLSNLRAIGSGSAPLSPWMVGGFQEHYGINVLNVFGSNEGMCLTSGPNDLPDPEERALYFPRFGVEGLEWDNRAASTIRTRLMDLASGEEVTAAGAQGELEIWGATVFDGYWESPEANAEVFSDDGYFRTGDVFEIAGTGEQARLYKFIGRCKDIIVRGGVNISPDEIDKLLTGHPKIAEAAVVGYPDEIMGERVGAVVVPKPNETIDLDEITEYLKALNLAMFKLPEQLRVVDEIPHNATGKVQRRDLLSLFPAS